MSAIDTGQAVDWVCQNQALVKGALAWAAAAIPASAVAWANAKWKFLPSWVGKAVQVVALNFVHAAAGEPTPAPKPLGAA